jgi:enoyl-CoA hydratase/carnithine racemase
VAFETLSYELDASGVATVVLDQPESRNALSDHLLDELLDALSSARADDEVRCVVITSSHPTTFSSGANLSGFGEETPLVHKHLGSERFVRLFRLLGELGKPSICAANGHVLAGALGIALACDLVVASENATFGTPEMSVGAFPFMVSALLYRNIPRKTANAMLLLGKRLTAEEACQVGIVNSVFPAGEFDAGVADVAGKLVAKSPLIMRLGKDAMFRQQDMALGDALEYLHGQLTVALSTDDVREGVQAFFEKRAPEWTGR